MIIVDNNEDEETENHVRTVSDPRVKYHRNPIHLGMTENWNNCLNLAMREGSEFLAIFHDDDIYYSRILQEEVGFLRAHPEAGMVYPASRHVCESQGHATVKRPWPADRLLDWDALMGTVCSGGEYFIATSGVLMRREAAVNTGFFDTRYRICPDLDYWWRMLDNYKVGYLAEVLMDYSIHPGQVSSSGPALINALSNREGYEYLSAATDRRKGVVDHPRIVKGIRAHLRRRTLSMMFRHLGAYPQSEIPVVSRSLEEYGAGAGTRLLLLFFKCFNNAVGRSLVASLLAARRIGARQPFFQARRD
jgi:hypothetical protein